MDASRSPGRGSARCVVVVEDDAAILDVVLTCLETEGIDVRGFRNPDDALRSAALDRAGLVLLDLTLPGMGGEPFLAALRARGRRVPVCIMTAAVEADELTRSLDVDGVLQKPFDLDDLIATVNRFV